MQPLLKFSFEKYSGSPVFGAATSLWAASVCRKASAAMRANALAAPLLQIAHQRGVVGLARGDQARVVGLGGAQHRRRVGAVAAPPGPRPLAEVLDRPFVVVGHDDVAGHRRGADGAERERHGEHGRAIVHRPAARPSCRRREARRS